jgi:diacylglycerol kinase (ATP)
MKNQFIFILNPLAGGGRGKDLMFIIQKYMDDTKLENYKIIHTNGIKDAILLSIEYGKNDNNILIAVGGDGTINEVVNGLLMAHENMSTISKLGIINCGSGAGFVQSLGMPADLIAQIGLFQKGQSRPVDVGQVSFTDDSGLIQNRYFVNECQIGIGGAVVSNVSLKHKRFGGKFAFGYVAVSQLIKYRATNMSITVDGGIPVIEKRLGITIGNGRFCAGGMQLTPSALLDDGLLDVLNIAEMNLIQRLNAFSKVYSGKHIYTTQFTLQKAKQIEIDSDIPVWVEADGELLGKTLCTVRLIPDAIQIYSPLNPTLP